MAIPPSKLSIFLDTCPVPEEALAKLRQEGLLDEKSSDDEVLEVIREAAKESADEVEAHGFTWASADTRIAYKLSLGHLSQKGVEWLEARPDESLDILRSTPKTGRFGHWVKKAFFSG